MRTVPLVEGEYYHLYNRGVDKRKVFTNPAEYKRFLAYIYMLNTTDPAYPSNFFRSHKADEVFDIIKSNPLVAIGAFCLMPNHFHLFVTPVVEKGVSKFMHRVETAYTKHFNEKHNRTGSLFGGTFKAEHVSSENHAKYLFSYIHLNPAKLQNKNWKTRKSLALRDLKEFVIKYPYSSYQEYASEHHQITNPLLFPAYLTSQKDITDHIESWLSNPEIDQS